MKALVAVLVLALQAPNFLLTFGPPPKDGVRLLLVRHGEAWKNLAIPGTSPEKEDTLTDGGRKQVTNLGPVLAAAKPSAIYSSPANRAKQTAVLLAKAIPAAGTPLEEAAVRAQDPPKETFADVGARVEAFAREMARTRPGQQIVVIAHSEVIGSYLMNVRGESRPAGPRLGSITVVDVPAEGAPRIQIVDYVP